MTESSRDTEKSQPSHPSNWPPDFKNPHFLRNFKNMTSLRLCTCKLLQFSKKTSGFYCDFQNICDYYCSFAKNGNFAGFSIWKHQLWGLPIIIFTRNQMRPAAPPGRMVEGFLQPWNHHGMIQAVEEFSWDQLGLINLLYPINCKGSVRLETYGTNR